MLKRLMLKRLMLRFPNPAQLSVPRALSFYALGASVGLAIAAYGLFSASGTTTRSVAPENVATVNQRPILRSDFIAQLEMETGKTFSESTHAEQLKVLDEMVREELLVQRALELDFGETDQNARNALVSAISDQAIAEVTTSQPSEQQLREYFRQHPGKWATEGTMSLRDFVVTAVPENRPSIDSAARQIAALLRAGAPAEPLLARHALQESSHQVDEYYFALAFRLGAPLFAAVRTLSAGEVSEPVALADGIHVVLVEMNAKPVPYTYEQAHAQISSDYNAEAQAKRMATTLAFLRTRAKILIAPDYGDYSPNYGHPSL